MRRILIVGLLLIGCFVFGCGFDTVTEEDECLEPETIEVLVQGELVAPRGVTTDTGDGLVIVWWYATYQDGVAGYDIYRSYNYDGEYDWIGEAGAENESFTDEDVANGTTYYYAVSAFSDDDRESHLSYEEAEDTPRPEGTITLYEPTVNKFLAGFNLNGLEIGHRQWEHSDIFLSTNDKIPLVKSMNGTVFQDLGYFDSIYAVDSAPLDGYVEGYIEAFAGHIYGVYTAGGHYAVFRVDEIFLEWKDGEDSILHNGWMEITWAVQLQKGNLELAPRRESK